MAAAVVIIAFKRIKTPVRTKHIRWSGVVMTPGGGVPGPYHRRGAKAHWLNP
jgi:hypothetical protein